MKGIRFARCCRVNVIPLGPCRRRHRPALITLRQPMACRSTRKSGATVARRGAVAHVFVAQPRDWAIP